MKRYLFLTKESEEDSWRYLGEAEAFSPEDAVEQIARSELHQQGSGVQLDDVLNNFYRFSYWRIIPVELDEDGKPQMFSRSNLNLDKIG